MTREGYVLTDDGVRLFFRRIGDAPATVIVPNGFHLIDDFASLSDHRTLICYDVRNRGLSDAVTDASKVADGILHDVDDLEAVRRHAGFDSIDLLGHSYVGVTVALYAMRYPAHANRVVQVGPAPPDHNKEYPAHLTNNDSTLHDVLGKILELQKERNAYEAVEFCRKVWELLRFIYVTDAANADRIKWGRCELPNERGMMKYWTERILPSLRRLELSGRMLAKATAPVLIVHGTKDRSAPYGGAREWASLLPNARLVTVKDGSHAPWIEDPDAVFTSIATFLDGAWPSAAETVKGVEPL